MADQRAYRYAPLGKRIAAKSIDVLVASGIVMAIVAVGLDSLMALFSGMMIALAYMLLADSMKGRSVGKRVLGLQVVDYRHGSPCTPLQSFSRNVAGFGLLRILVETEEADERAKGRFLGTVVIDLFEPKPASKRAFY